MDTLVRSMLIESARQNRPLVYSDVMRRIKFDHTNQYDRNKFSKILEDISRFEHSKKRPLLSAQIIYKGSGEIGKKFYWLASELGYGTQRDLEARMFEVEMMIICHEFWIDKKNYDFFCNDNEKELMHITYSTILKRMPIPANGIALQEFSYANHDIDWIALTKENTLLGKAGEELVKQYEKDILSSASRKDLAAKVAKVNDGQGYDILSYYSDGREKYIEVKTTKSDPNTSFPITAREKEFSKENPGCYHLYRLYNFIEGRLPVEFFEFKGNLDIHFHFDTLVYRAYRKRQEPN